LAAPVYPIMLSTQFDADVQYSDVAFVAIEIGLILVEVFADQQQWSKLLLLLKYHIRTEC
jgi:steroid 5-alpha reductase family enzyme